MVIVRIVIREKGRTSVLGEQLLLGHLVLLHLRGLEQLPLRDGLLVAGAVGDAGLQQAEVLLEVVVVAVVGGVVHAEVVQQEGGGVQVVVRLLLLALARVQRLAQVLAEVVVRLFAELLERVGRAHLVDALEADQGG